MVVLLQPSPFQVRKERNYAKGEENGYMFALRLNQKHFRLAYLRPSPVAFQPLLFLGALGDLVANFDFPVKHTKKAARRSGLFLNNFFK